MRTGRENTRVPGLVIFDCDGVLVDTEPTSPNVLAEMIGSTGWPVPAEGVRQPFAGETLDNIVAGVEGKTGRPLPAGWVAEFRARRDDAFRDGTEPIAGAAD